MEKVKTLLHSLATASDPAKSHIVETMIPCREATFLEEAHGKGNGGQGHGMDVVDKIFGIFWAKTLSIRCVPKLRIFRAVFEDVFSGLYRAMLCKRLPLISNSQHLLLSRDSLTQWWRAIVRESPGQLRPGGGEEGTGVLF